jgi:hypothetical protein
MNRLVASPHLPFLLCLRLFHHLPTKRKDASPKIEASPRLIYVTLMPVPVG